MKLFTHSMVSTIITVNFHISLKYQCLTWKPVNVKVRGSICYNVKISFNYIPVIQYSKKNVYIKSILPPFTSVKAELSKQNEQIYYLSVIILSVTPNKTSASDNSKCIQLIHISFIKA